MGASCIGICKRIRMPKPKKMGGFYRNGFKRCTYCEWFVKPEVLIKKGYNDKRCPCCKLVLSSRPNKKLYREKLKVQGIKN